MDEMQALRSRIVNAIERGECCFQGEWQRTADEVLAEIAKEHVIVDRGRANRLLVEPTLEIEAVMETENVSEEEALRRLGWEPGDLDPFEDAT